MGNFDKISAKNSQLGRFRILINIQGNLERKRLVGAGRILYDGIVFSWKQRSLRQGEYRSKINKNRWKYLGELDDFRLCIYKNTVYSIKNRIEPVY